MKTSSLLKVSIIFMILGISAVVALSHFLEPPIILIENINELMLDEFVKINGTIIDIRNIDTTSILTIEDKTASINAVQYNKNFSINPNIRIKISIHTFLNYIKYLIFFIRV